MRWVEAYMLAGLAWAIYAQAVKLMPMQPIEWWREYARDTWDVSRHGAADARRVERRARWARRAAFAVLFLCDLLLWWVAIAWYIVMPSKQEP
jgi:hypothetical protein